MVHAAPGSADGPGSADETWRWTTQKYRDRVLTLGAMVVGWATILFLYKSVALSVLACLVQYRQLPSDVARIESQCTAKLLRVLSNNITAPVAESAIHLAQATLCSLGRPGMLASSWPLRWTTTSTM